ncbi:hypothetical protein M0802_011501 [Mischocyttarus mexicanus]|nr:hypothetical protein M0802_011501 [Mischocyttarus mexicanus]
MRLTDVCEEIQRCVGNRRILAKQNARTETHHPPPSYYLPPTINQPPTRVVQPNFSSRSSNSSRLPASNFYPSLENSSAD